MYIIDKNIKDILFKENLLEKEFFNFLINNNNTFKFLLKYELLI